jgi:hypothetical protein
VRWPAVDEVGVVGEVVSGVDVMVAGGHDRVVPVVAADVSGHGCGDGTAAFDGKRSAFTEIVLYVDDEQGGADGFAHIIPLTVR